MAVLVGDGETSTDKLRVFNFIDKGNGVIFGGDAALPIFVCYELIGTRPIASGTLSRSDEGGRTDIGPIEIGRMVDLQGIAMSQGHGPPSLREIGRINKLYPRRNLQASSSTDHNEPLHASMWQPCEQRARGIDDNLWLLTCAGSDC